MDMNSLWYQRRWYAYCLWPLSCCYGLGAWLHRLLYRWGIKKRVRFAVPVIVVGNLTVGGTGKSPLVAYLATCLQQNGYRVGMVSRGYGGQALSWPQWVGPDSNPMRVGDEPVMLAQQTGLPVAVAPVRAQAVALLLEHHNCNLIISDDGLQHHGLHRDIEIVVVDHQRGFGNGMLLPAGPLRERTARLHRVDFVLQHGAQLSDEVQMCLQAANPYQLISGKETQLSHFSGLTVHAVAGIGHPQRFFNLLAAAGIDCIEHVFADHHQYCAKDFQFDDDAPIVMTEKDAVKCVQFACNRCWCVPVRPCVQPSFVTSLLTRLADLPAV